MKKITISKKEFIKIDNTVSKALKLIRSGYQKNKVINIINKKTRNLKLDPEDIYIIARMRIKAKEKFGELTSKLFFDESGYRYSTPAIVAEYRAKRLKFEKIADVSCGAGIQLIFFDKYSDETEGVEICKKRAYLAALNSKSLNANCSIYNGDAFKFKTNAELIFSDPARPEKEEVREIDSLRPNPVKIIKHFKNRTFVFELPPQMPPDRVDEAFSKNFSEYKMHLEKEYTSVNFRLNRLAVYTGEIASCSISAISLPTEEKVTNEDERIKLNHFKLNNNLSRLYNIEYLCEVDNTITHSKLLENLAGKLELNAEILKLNQRRTMLITEDLVNSSFLRYYEVENVCKFKIEEIKRALKDIGAKKVTLRFKINPKEYWNVRKELEEDLYGEKHVYLFKFGDYGIIARRFS